METSSVIAFEKSSLSVPDSFQESITFVSPIKVRFD